MNEVLDIDWEKFELLTFDVWPTEERVDNTIQVVVESLEDIRSNGQDNMALEELLTKLLELKEAYNE